MEQNKIMQNIEAMEQYTNELRNYLARLNDLYATGQIDEETYESKMGEMRNGRNPLQWLAYYEDQLQENKRKYAYSMYAVSEKNTNLHLIIAVLAVIGIFSFLFMKPSITGLYVGTPLEVHESGYLKEGQKWVDIRGMRFYERCLKVTSEIPFNAVELSGKIASTANDKGLAFVLYKSDVMNNQPGLLVNLCNVDKYGDVWKSCKISDLREEKGEYWACASYPEGEYGKTYYMLAYQNGDQGRTAFWTGQNWQKLDRSTYTIKARFIQYE